MDALGARERRVPPTRRDDLVGLGDLAALIHKTSAKLSSFLIVRTN